MNRILVEPDEVDSHDAVILTGRRARHLLKVIGVVEGQGVRIGQIDGPLGQATVAGVGEERVDLLCEWTAPPGRPRVDLLLAMPRPKVMRRLWAQLSAMGVGRVMLINAKRVERCYFDTHWLDPQVVRAHLIEGLEQSGDTRLPDVCIERQFRVAVEDRVAELYGDETTRLLADPDPCTPAPGQWAPRVLLAIGPEGGWVPFERALLRANGFTPFALGSRTLRTDTACVALIAAVNTLMSV